MTCASRSSTSLLNRSECDVSGVALTDLRKSFGAIAALDGLTMSAKFGSVHAVLGENGAGKSTMIKVLGGVVRPDFGDISIAGVALANADPRDSCRAGVAVAFQETSLSGDLTVAESIWRDSLPRGRLRIVDRRKLEAITRELLERFEAPSLRPDERIRRLSVAQRQIVEVLRAVRRQPRVLVLDEATASLSAAEAAWVLRLARSVASDGALVLFVSHRINEIRRVADAVTVLRGGRAVATMPVEDASDDRLIELMLGRKPQSLYRPATAVVRDEKVLEVKGLRSGRRVKDVNLFVRAGEIVGIGGLQGQGQSELLYSIFGARRHHGHVAVSGRVMKSSRRGARLHAGIALVPEDRRSQGLLLGKSIRENISIANPSLLGPAGFVSPVRETALSSSVVDRFQIRADGINQPVETLSGGNQQKVVIAKFLASPRPVLLLDDPTRGIDIGTKAELFRLMRTWSEEGVALLFSSSDATELVNMCDRVLVMRNGAVHEEIGSDTLSEDELLRAALGLRGRSSTVA